MADAGEPSALTDEGGAYNFEPFNPSRALGVLSRYDANGNGVLDAEEGQLRALGGTLPGPIENDFLTGYAPGVGAGRIFFDANRNGVLDAGEVSVVPDGDGFYSFANLASIAMDTLGRLKPFDANGNGMIDPAEGKIIITGGLDKNTGLPNSERVEVPVSAAGDGF